MIPGVGDRADLGNASGLRRRGRRALPLFAILAVIGIATTGYSLGLSRGINVDAAYFEGLAAGEQRGKVVGARQGYDSAFPVARKRAYGAAYRDAYGAAYRDEFDAANLPDPRRVKVSMP